MPRLGRSPPLGLPNESTINILQLSTSGRSGVQILPVTLIAIPGAAIGAVVLSKWGKCRLLHIIGFALLTDGMGSLSVLDRHSSISEWVCLQILLSIGAGMALDTLLPASQAGVEEHDAAAATASWIFIRSFGNTWGVAIPASVFNTYTYEFAATIYNELATWHMRQGDAYASATKEFVAQFPEPWRSQVIDVFTGALRKIFLVSIGFAALAYLLSFVERELKLRTELKTEFGLEERQSKAV